MEQVRRQRQGARRRQQIEAGRGAQGAGRVNRLVRALTPLLSIGLDPAFGCTRSSSFDEFSRKWNRPVHEFLLRHIYLETMVTYKASRLNATAATLLFSLLLHEVRPADMCMQTLLAGGR